MVVKWGFVLWTMVHVAQGLTQHTMATVETKTDTVLISSNIFQNLMMEQMAEQSNLTAIILILDWEVANMVVAL